MRTSVLDVAYILASQKKEDGTMCWPHEAGAILALCRNVDSRVIVSLCQHEYLRCKVLFFFETARTRLCHAARTGNGRRVQELLDHGADVNAAFPPPLAHAVYQGHDAVARVLMAAGATLHPCMQALEEMGELAFSDTYLDNPSSCRRVRARRDLIKELCADPAAAIYPEEILRLGVNYGICSLVRATLDVAADMTLPNNPDEYAYSRLVDWWTNLDWSPAPRIKALRVLAACPEINFEWFEQAALHGSKSLVRYLCSLNPKEYDENLALFAACGVGDMKLVKKLLSHDGHARGNYFPPWKRQSIVLYSANMLPWGSMPSYHLAAQHGHVDVVRYVLRWLRAKPRHEDLTHCLMAAAACGLMVEARALLARGVDVNAYSCESHPESPLSVACLCAQVNMVRLLLGAGATPNAGGSRGTYRSPLYCAAISGAPGLGWKPLPAPAEELLGRRRAIVGLLLSAGAVLSAKDDRAWVVGERARVVAFVEEVRAGAAYAASATPA
jgi:ankyrin repeat protein